MAKKLNILFFLTDDQRFDTIHALGNTQIITPHMDKLVDQGTAFTQAHIPSGTSAAVCMPSRAMLHTGRTLFHLLNEGQNIPENHVTLGEALKKGGYRTFGAGKWHNGTSSYARSFTDGGAIFFGGMWDHWNVPICDYDPTGHYDRKIPFTMNFMANNQLSHVHGDRFSDGKHSSELISDTAIDFLSNYESDQPFFMYLSYLAPHDPRTMPQRFKDMYEPDKIDLPENFMEEHLFRYGVEAIRDEQLAAYPRSSEVIKGHIAEYYAMISHLDDEIGRVMDVLNHKGIADDTIVILAGDNGLAVGQHGLLGKQNHYEHSIRVPLILSGPGIAKGRTTSSYCYLLDLFPTLCDLIEIEIPSTVEGKSLVPVLKNSEHKVRETLYFAYKDLIRSVKDNRFKLIEYAGNIRKTQLFDLSNDPWEMRDLYDDKYFSEVVERLRSELIRYRDEWEEGNHPIGKTYWKNY